MRSFSVPRLPLAALGFLVIGALLSWVPDGAVWRGRVWFAGLILVGAPVAWKTLRGMLHGEFASDVVAMLAIVGAIGLQQPLAGLVVVLMQTGGEALETYAVARASGAVEALEADAPRTAHRVVNDVVSDIEAIEIIPNDTILVRAGELVPCDGVVISGESHVDTSRLTGEPVPITARAGTTLLSGSVNQEGAITLRAVRTSQESQYARIVELVRSAQASKSPLQRTADKVAVWFTPLTLLVCLIGWLISHDVSRVLAVLVVATPCPLILAAPVAIIGGINRAAKRAIIIRNGGALEALANVTCAVFDKTGTLTIGKPRVHEVFADDGVPPNDLLALAAAIEQGSGHLLARVVVGEAESRALKIGLGADLKETTGRGIRGTVDGESVAVGSSTYVREQLPALSERVARMDASATGLRAYVGSSRGALGRIEFADELRADLPQLFAEFNRMGIRDTLLLSGDRTENVAAVAASLHIASFAGDLSAEDKVKRVQALESRGTRVLMVGDGTNDAPALSAASVGVALAGHGGGVVAEAADVVLLVDDPTRVAEAVRVGRRAMMIARQSIGVGLGLSFVGMIFAALGYLPPVAGALTQEAIDVAVILNALRASVPGREG